MPAGHNERGTSSNLMTKCFSILCLLALLTSPAFSGDTQTIEGNLEIAKNMFVIVTDRALSAGGEFDDSIVKSRRVELIGYSSEQVGALTKLVGKRVRATGILGQAFTQHHTEPLIISLKELPKKIK
jgi:hypothetical protein